MVSSAQAFLSNAIVAKANEILQLKLFVLKIGCFFNPILRLFMLGFILDHFLEQFYFRFFFFFITQQKFSAFLTFELGLEPTQLRL